jgi:hypothetical protein
MQAIPSFSRGMPLWREKQRALPVAQKIEMLGRLIQETRQLEIIKKFPYPDGGYSSSSPKTSRFTPSPCRHSADVTTR